MQKIVILRWDGHLRATGGSARPEAAARILGHAVNAEDRAEGETETVWIAHGEFDVEPYEVPREDADLLVQMLMDADREAHQAGQER